LNSASSSVKREEEIEKYMKYQEKNKKDFKTLLAKFAKKPHKYLNCKTYFILSENKKQYKNVR
jgi:hypothetical protein